MTYPLEDPLDIDFILTSFAPVITYLAVYFSGLHNVVKSATVLTGGERRVAVGNIVGNDVRIYVCSKVTFFFLSLTPH